MSDLESRVRRLEDRVAISEVVIRYCLNVDRKDWPNFARCFTDPVLTDYQDGRPTGLVGRTELVDVIAEALDGFDLTQHLSTNHVITFDDGDADRAVCESAMVAQHQLLGSTNGEFYLLRAIYTDHLRRTPEGWRIEGIETERRWEEGNLTAVDEAIHRTRARRASADAASPDLP